MDDSVEPGGVNQDRVSASPTLSIHELVPQPISLSAGDVVGNYTILSKLGQGGMGIAYKAVDKRLDREVALKVISPGSVTDRDKLLFAREAKAASALNHPNIVTIYEFDSAAGIDFIAMEFVAGKTLSEVLLQHETPLSRLLDYARQTAMGLARAHSAGIVHRDLKPANIMITADGQVKVLDFGLARREEAARDPKASEAELLTHTGSIIGTPSYMSPEQALAEHVDWRADIFSLGVILYEMTCGKRPFEGKGALATLYEVTHKQPAPPLKLNPGGHPGLAALILKCLRKRPEDRPQSMQKIAVELEHLAVLTTKRPARRGYKGLLAGVLLALFSAGGLYLSRPHSAMPTIASVGATQLLTYAIEIRKGAKGAFVGEVAPPDSIFRGGSGFRLRMRPSTPGFLYLINQGPGGQAPIATGCSIR